jgi:hypothetical protein
VLVLFFSFIIWRQPEVSSIRTFKIPFVPFIPFLSVFFNVYMMTTLGGATWIRFIIWFVIGKRSRQLLIFDFNILCLIIKRPCRLLLIWH